MDFMFWFENFMFHDEEVIFQYVYSIQISGCNLSLLWLQCKMELDYLDAFLNCMQNNEI